MTTFICRMLVKVLPELRQPRREGVDSAMLGFYYIFHRDLRAKVANWHRKELKALKSH